MTKQEEILEFVKFYLVGSIHGARVKYEDISDYDQSTVDFLSEELLGELSKRDVVIKVEKALPENLMAKLASNEAYSEAQQDMLRAGYVAVESLRKEEK